MIRSAPSVVLAVAIPAILLGHLLPFGDHSLLLQNLRNALHGPAFLVFSIIVWRALYPRYSALATNLFTGLVVIAVAAGGELLQRLNGYAFSPSDIAIDLFGCATALLYLNGRAAGRGSGWSATACGVMRIGALLLFVALLMPAAWWSLAIGARAAAMPQLMKLEYPWQRVLIDPRGTTATPVAAPAGWLTGVERIMRIETAAARYSGVAVPDPYPDWRGYQALSFYAASADDGRRRLTLRIHDEAHDQSYPDRFNRAWQLAPVPEKFCIPLADVVAAPASRPLDLGAIAGLSFFVTRPNAGDVFLLGDVRLEKTGCE